MDEKAVEEMVAALHGAGVNFFDHSEAYGGANRGAPEVMFGKTVRKLGIKRSDLVVSSKIFNHYNNVGMGPNEIGLSRKHLREGMEDILARLEMDYVDVISAHRPDHLTPIEETVRGFNWLIDQGHALYWGTSNWSAQQLTEANEVAKRLDMVGPIAEQPPYSSALGVGHTFVDHLSYTSDINAVQCSLAIRWKMSLCPFTTSTALASCATLLLQEVC